MGITAMYKTRRETAEVRFISEDTGQTLDVAHCWILRMQSPVLNAMLGSVMKEGQTWEIHIQKDFCSVWPLVTRFCYGVTEEKTSFDHAVMLRAVADYYAMHELADVSRSVVLQTSMTLPKVLQILQVAGFDERLRAHAWNFLDTCPLRLFNDPGCLLLNERDLAEFLSRNTLLCDEIEIFKCVRRWSQGRASRSATKNAGKDRCTRARPLPQSLLDAIRFENMSPDQLNEAKPFLTSDSYLALLEVVSGAVPREARPRKLRESAKRFRCTSCSKEVLGGPDCRPVEAECKRFHPGSQINPGLCTDHKNRCPTCARCKKRVWSCCRREGSSGCTILPHSWKEVARKRPRHLS